jgi:hypothetical protein
MRPAVAERYQLLRRIGEARSGEVWEAYDERLDRTVELRLASPADVAAQQQLRTLLRQRRLGEQPDAPRILDGGDDPEYGTFLVAELNERNGATRPIPPVLAPPQPTRRRGDPQVGAKVLLPLILGIGILVVLVARAALAPVGQPGPTSAEPATPAPPNRPLSGARANQPTTAPTPVPTLAAASRQSAAPQPTVAPPTTAPTPQPTPATPAQAATSPVDTVRQHYALINAKNYSAGYQLMDSHLQSLNSPSDYAGWFVNKVSVQPVSVDLVSQNDGEAVVRSTVSSTDRVNGQDVTTQVSEEFVLRNENGAWRIDQVARLG